ncbi:MAG: DUF58 domain-containing protein [Halobacteriales archaeon]
MREYTLTNRGRAVVAICGAAALMAWLFGARALGAVVLPGIVALAGAALQLRRIDPPEIRRDLPPDDAVGATHEVGLRFVDPATGASPASPFVADVVEATGSGLSDPPTVRVVVGEATTTYPVSYERRGSPTVGPARIRATDVLGLLVRRMEAGPADRVLVYPGRHPIAARFRRRLYREGGLGTSRQRDEFDRLREYDRGDPLRDVSWSATAKRDELIVTEFAAEAERAPVSIAGGAEDGGADDLATATASVALALLDDGVPVSVDLPNGSVEVGPTPEGRRRLLELLALATGGEPPETDADAVIEADLDGTRVRVGDAELSFEEVRMGGEATGEPGGVGRIPAGETA